MISTWPPNENGRILEFRYSCGNQRHFHFLNNHHWLYWRQKAFSWEKKWFGFNSRTLFPVIKFADCLQLYHGQSCSMYKGSFYVCVWGAHAQSCLTLFCNPMDCSPPGSPVHGVFQAGILEWVAISSCRGSFWPRDWTWVSCSSRHILFRWATFGKPCLKDSMPFLSSGLITIL